MPHGFGGPFGPHGPGGHGGPFGPGGPGEHGGPGGPFGPGGGRRGGFLQPCLLLLLAEGPQHGYTLMEALNRQQLLDHDVDVGNLYRALRRMEHDGLVTSLWNTHERGPNKRVDQRSPRRGKHFFSIGPRCWRRGCGCSTTFWTNTTGGSARPPLILSAHLRKTKL